MLNKPRRGLTLVEVIVVLLVLVLAMTLLVPGLMEARQQARRRDCANKLRTVALAMHNYQKTYSVFPSAGVMHLPNGDIDIKLITKVDPAMGSRAPWTVLLLPYLGETARYNRFNMEAPFYTRYDEIAGSGPRDGTPNNTFAQDQDAPNAYHCPDNPASVTDPYILSYYACQGGGNTSASYKVGPNWKGNRLGPTRNTAERMPNEEHMGGNGQLIWDSGIFYPNSSTKFQDVRDGTSQTIMLGEQAYVGLQRVYTPIKKSHGGPFHWTWSSAIRGHSKHPAFFSTAVTFDPINDPGEWPEGIERVREIGGALRGYGQQQRGFSSWHAGGANFAFADGGVRFLNENMDLFTYQIMGPMRDGFVSGSSQWAHKFNTAPYQ